MNASRKEGSSAVEDGSQRRGGRFWLIPVLLAGAIAAAWWPGSSIVAGGEAIQAPVAGATITGRIMEQMTTQFSAPVVFEVALLLCMSAFFSASETALFSIHRLRLRAMRDESTLSGPMVARFMDRPSEVLTTILVGNMIVNVLIGVLLGGRVDAVMQAAFASIPDSRTWAYLCAVGVCTAVLVLCGEITPKAIAVTIGEPFARVAIFPLSAIKRLLSPLCGLLLKFTEGLFRVSRFHKFRAMPFITDEEFRSVLSNGEAQGVLEEEERQMIQGILEFREAMLSELVTPRRDVVAIPDTAAAADALQAMREHEYSRMPVYHESMDDVVGVLVAKDLLQCFISGVMDTPVRELMRSAHFVPRTMTARQFFDEARRHRFHMAIVVDEYGGTEGIVTLEDALAEVAGVIADNDEPEPHPILELGPGQFRILGSCPIDDLTERFDLSLEDDEHATIGGLLMDLADKVPEPGDCIVHGRYHFVVEACEGKRLAAVRMDILADSAEREVSDKT